MYLFLVLGTAFAFGHHAYYQSFQGALVFDDRQLTTMRYGTVLAFAAKSCLVFAVMSAFREQMWFTFSNKFLRVTTINGLFAAPETPLSLLDIEFLRKAKIAAALTIYCWASPLSVILTTSTLTTVPSQETVNATCPGVRSLNFSLRNKIIGQSRARINDLDQQALVYWNETSNNESDEHFLEYYTAPTGYYEDFFDTVTYLQEPILHQKDVYKVCEKGWNCTVEIHFVGPAFKCSEIIRGDEGPGFLQQSSGRADIPFDVQDLAPTGNHTYIAKTLLGEYANPQLEVLSGGKPTMPPPYPKHLGALRTEPIIWIGYSELKEDYNFTELLGENPDVQRPDAFTTVVIACEHFVANYTLETVYRDGVQTPNITAVDLISPIINTTYIPDREADDGTLDKTVAEPESSYILPQDTERYTRTAIYHSMGLMIRMILSGKIEGIKQSSDENNAIKVLKTNLIDPRISLPRRNIAGLIASWYPNIFISLFARPRFQAVVWARKTDEQTGTRTAGANSRADYMYKCTRSRPAVKYIYNERILVSAYSVLIFLALLGVLAGTTALRRNAGVSRGTEFSSIVEATRGPILNKIDWGERKKYRSVKIGYGLLKVRDGDLKRPEGESLVNDPVARHVRSSFGFGFEGHVDQLKAER
ncbi:hypothetical protein CPLU01_14880 [Colletotrichum plurivorum]|uniref:Uncharacterized protein n=1 Tax=Colletotrichum plurivorum TaxID=2175906 RepID=A0A8H6JG17_9PEZI|nr:hypothetical protein CPLU01_14880 [Colletotrichum plurivorum]